MLNIVLPTITEITAAALLLWGVWNREKLIDFESELKDKIARLFTGIEKTN